MDPLGLYQIADQLATQLVPAVRERMQRVRFLTAIAIGALVTEGVELDVRQSETPAFLVWEWLVVEAFIRELGDDPGMWGVPGTLVTRQALAQYGYLDHRSYLKTPRIFGFHGVYKRLAIRGGLVDVHMGSCGDGERLVDAWARDAGHGSLEGCRPILAKWKAAVQRSIDQTPARTRPAWNKADWAELAAALTPHRPKSREKRFLRELLNASDEHSLGALPHIWTLQEGFTNEDYTEEVLHVRLERAAPIYSVLLNAIRDYEAFCRSLQDAFDILRAEAQGLDAHGFSVPSIAQDKDFASSICDIQHQYESARR